MTARLTVLSGPSGVGKSTVYATVRKRHPDFWLSVSVTTRHPRPGEREGVQYYFLDRDRFAAMQAAGDLLESAQYAGHLYGTPAAPVRERLDAGTPVLLEIELQGARQVREAMPDAQLVFLAPPSWNELERRLLGRGTENADLVARRLDHAMVEMAAQSEFDAVIYNDDVSRAADELVQLVLAPQRSTG